MNPAQFNDSLNRLIHDATKILTAAEKEYATDADRLSNFKSISDIDPELVCFVYLCKHIDGIRNYTTGRARNQRDSIRGRIIDAMNYLILLNAIIEENVPLAEPLHPDKTFFSDDGLLLSTQMLCPIHNTSLARYKHDTDWFCHMCRQERNLAQYDKDNRSPTDRRIATEPIHFNEDK